MPSRIGMIHRNELLTVAVILGVVFGTSGAIAATTPGQSLGPDAGADVAPSADSVTSPPPQANDSNSSSNASDGNGGGNQSDGGQSGNASDGNNGSAGDGSQGGDGGQARAVECDGTDQPVSVNGQPAANGSDGDNNYVDADVNNDEESAQDCDYVDANVASDSSSANDSDRVDVDVGSNSTAANDSDRIDVDVGSSNESANDDDDLDVDVPPGNSSAPSPPESPAVGAERSD